MQIKSSLVLSLLLVCSQSEIAYADWYKSTAEPSLVVRDAPDVGGAKIGNVPVDGKVDVLERVGKEESIGGNSGHWVKIQWKDKTAYAFDAFLTPIADDVSESQERSSSSTKSKSASGKALSVDDVLDKVYEGFDAKNNCRRYHSDQPDYYYCMKVDRVDTLTTEEASPYTQINPFPTH
ncbi:SH3 domain-containing protein [Thiothrix subterranea]|uniref:SH3 domain-containing protein n=1 Tax=Thiothrix subterranea TaxID=2735563 RepID=UPI00192C2746|nr:SH3 domain-containing protein [Thiothrix subterranea]QQZ28107.1 SH3 domain-containing protein [Thiothrix subterranea]